MKRYVAGFAFDSSRPIVALVIKNRPAWQASKLNGIGGHIEEGETPNQAMAREFEEETGAKTREDAWYHYVTLSGEDFEVYFFYQFFYPLPKLETKTDEKILVLPIAQINAINAIPNLTWLIPMARNFGYDRASRFSIKEEY